MLWRRNAVTPALPFLDTLQFAAEHATAAETEFRREIAQRAKTLEVARSSAFRRLNLMRAIAEAVAHAESEEVAVAGATAVLRTKLGWWSDSEARDAVLSRFAPVAEAVFANMSPEALAFAEGGEAERPDVVGTLAEFERWYAETHPNSFWVLFENYMPETPVVDF
jgi:hypothetical protein